MEPNTLQITQTVLRSNKQNSATFCFAPNQYAFDAFVPKFKFSENCSDRIGNGNRNQNHSIKRWNIFLRSSKTFLREKKTQKKAAFKHKT